MTDTQGEGMGYLRDLLAFDHVADNATLGELERDLPMVGVHEPYMWNSELDCTTVSRGGQVVLQVRGPFHRVRAVVLLGADAKLW